MLKRLTVLLLVVLLACYGAPVSAQTTEEEWTAYFTAELNEYAAMHSEEETRAYAQYRLDQLTYANLIPEATQTNVFEAGILAEVLYGAGAWSDTTTIYLDLDYEFNLSNKLRECTWRKQEQCRTNYNAEVLTAHALTIGVFAGCNAITVGAGFIACVVAALAAHALLIQAARERYGTCHNNAAWECRKELGML